MTESRKDWTTLLDWSRRFGAMAKSEPIGEKERRRNERSN